MATEIVSAQQLREVLHYCPETGVFTWRVSTSNIKGGDVAGYKRPDGRIDIRVLDRLYKAHRLAWLHVHGEWPVGQIDHINGDPGNNALANLRDVSQSVNLQNQRRARSHNTSGFMGVSRNGEGWMARIVVDGKMHHIGTFETPEFAHIAYLETKRRLHPGNML